MYRFVSMVVYVMPSPCKGTFSAMLVIKIDFFVSLCRVIVGAPEDETEQLRLGIEKAGAVYRCQTVMPYRCHPIPFDTSGKTRPTLE